MSSPVSDSWPDGRHEMPGPPRPASPQRRARPGMSTGEMTVMVAAVVMLSVTSTATVGAFLLAWRGIPVPLNFDVIALPWGISAGIAGLWAVWHALGDPNA
jgi:hypothetical protein